MAPDNEDFRLGIQKCHKTIQDSVSDRAIFMVPGAQILFKLLATASELQDDGLKGYVGKKKKSLSLKGLLTKMTNSPSGGGGLLDIAKASKAKAAGAAGAGAGGAKASAASAEKSTEGAAAGILANQVNLGGDVGMVDVGQLKAIELILGRSMPTFDAKTEHEKAIGDARTKAQKLFGDAKERSAAKKKEKIKTEDEDGDEVTKKPKKKVRESITQMMMKAELKTAEDEDQRQRKLKERKEKAEAAIERKNKAKTRVLTTSDRLLEDKVYLSMLAEGGIGVRADLPEDHINEDVAYEAKEALDFLNAREKFWDQLDLGSDTKRKMGKKDTKALESFRWLM